MAGQSDPTENLRPELDEDRVKFLKTELAMCFIFADFAATRLEFGNQESARQSIRDAEQAYEIISNILSDPTHVSYLTADQIREFTAELRRLREKLDGL